MSIDFFDNGLLTFCHYAKGTFLDIKHFHDQTETSWKQKDTELQDELKNRLQEIPKDHHDEYISSYGLDLHSNQILFPNIHRNSIVISIHSYLEDMLHQLVQIFGSCVEDCANFKSFKKKFQGSNVASAKAYIAKVGNLDLSSVEDEWLEIMKINQLRNQLVHEAGFLPTSAEDELNQYVSNNVYLSGEPNSKVNISSGYIVQYIDFLIKFFDGLDEQIAQFTMR